jgi:hypothetical protein
VGRFAAAAAFVTALSAGLVWLNEGPGVACLQAQRRQLLAGAEGAEE